MKLAQIVPINGIRYFVSRFYCSTREFILQNYDNTEADIMIVTEEWLMQYSRELLNETNNTNIKSA